MVAVFVLRKFKEKSFLFFVGTISIGDACNNGSLILALSVDTISNRPSFLSANNAINAMAFGCVLSAEEDCVVDHETIF